MVLRIYKGSIICGYNCMTNKKNMFVYRARTRIEGYMLRKHAWFDLMDQFQPIASILKSNVVSHYTNKIQKKIEWQKQKFLEKLKKSKGKKQIIVIMDLEKVDHLVDKIGDMAVNINFSPYETKRQLLRDANFRKQFVVDNTIDMAEMSYRCRDAQLESDEWLEKEIEDDKARVEESLEACTNSMSLIYNHLENSLSVQEIIKRELMKARIELNKLKEFRRDIYDSQRQSQSRVT